MARDAHGVAAAGAGCRVWQEVERGQARVSLMRVSESALQLS